MIWVVVMSLFGLEKYLLWSTLIVEFRCIVMLAFFVPEER